MVDLMCINAFTLCKEKIGKKISRSFIFELLNNFRAEYLEERKATSKVSPASPPPSQHPSENTVKLPLIALKIEQRSVAKNVTVRFVKNALQMN